METLTQDIRYAIRSLLRSPAFTLAAVATLAIGIGANTAIFSVVDQVLLRPAPFAGTDRVMMVWETDRNTGTTREPASIPDFRDFQVRSKQFEKLAAFSPVEVNLTGGSFDPQRLAALGVTQDYFATLNIPIIEGRGFTAEEDVAGGPRAVIIGEEMWERRFERKREVIGQTIRLNDNEWTIVGVAPRTADFGVLQVLGSAAYMRSFADRGDRVRVDLWLPSRIGPNPSRGNHPIFVVGRLAPTATPQTAHEEMVRITADLEREFNQDNANRGANVEPLETVVFGQVRAAMFLLLGAVAMVLLVACVNVANLLLVRATNRLREVTVRTALGAGTGRIAQQFLVEGAMLALAGTLLGVLFAYAAVDVLAAMAPNTIPRGAEIAVNGRALGLTTAISLVIALVFGLLPTYQSRKLDLQKSLREDGGRGGSAGREHRRVRSSLVVAELAMATTLMVGAGLLIRSLWQLQGVDPGFTTAGIVKAEFQLPASRYPQDFQKFPNWPEQIRFYGEIESRLKAMPGVKSVAFASASPLDAGFTSSIRVVGREAEGASWPEPSIRQVSTNYFPTLNVPVLTGRGFDATDAATAPPVVVINKSAEERFFAGHTAIGSQIAIWGQARTVIGVMGNEHSKGLTNDAPPTVFMPLTQAPTASAVMLQMAGDATAGVALVRRVVKDVDPLLPLYGVQPLSETLKGTMAQRRFTMTVLIAFAAAALILAIVGVHGVLSYAVAQRTREIGIRVALGADTTKVRDLIIGDGARLATIGVAIGLAGALVLSRLMNSLLFGVGARDPLTFVGVAGLLAAVAVIASWLPARRASRVDPIVALRAD
jgi:putative ABC transport system permease protein